MPRLRLFVVGIAMSMTLCVFAAGAADQPIAVRLGVSAPLTGGSEAIGVSLRNGARLAAQEIKATLIKSTVSAFQTLSAYEATDLGNGG